MASGRFIVYYRVSTQQQGRSGLGLDAQRQAVSAYLDGGAWQLVAEFTEVETGKGSNALDKRSQPRQALEQCRKQKATFLIAKLDRLARNVHFITGLIEMRIPVHAGPPFRSMPVHDSGACRATIPVHAGPPPQGDSDSGLKRVTRAIVASFLPKETAGGASEVTHAEDSGGLAPQT